MNKNFLGVVLGCFLALSAAGNIYLVGVNAKERSNFDSLAEERAQQAAAKSDKMVEEVEKSKQQVTNDFLKLWAEEQLVFKLHWYGINTLQNPMDVWATQEIMTAVKPDIILEAGTYKGGSAILWAAILEHINPEGRIITIDIEDQRTDKAKNHPLAKEKVDFLLGGSTDPEIVAEVVKRAQGKRVLVILDSLHTADHVRDEINAYSPLVGPGSYIIVQDTNGLSKVEGWPWEACVEFAESNPDWEIDFWRERHRLTSNHYGFLKHLQKQPDAN